MTTYLEATKRKQDKFRIGQKPELKAYIASKLELRWSPDQNSNTNSQSI